MERAIQFDDGHAVAHSWKGFLLLLYTDQEEAAKQELERGLSLNPLLPDTNRGYATWWIHRGDFETGLTYLSRAQELQKRDYNSAVSAILMLIVLIGLRRFDEAEKVLTQFLDRGAPGGFLRLLKVVVDVARGRQQEARDAYAEMQKVIPSFTVEGRLKFIGRVNHRVAQWCEEQLRAIGVGVGSEGKT
jgi:tetratricopeptide (TPR) repeat protein